MPGCMYQIRIPTYQQPRVPGDIEINPSRELLTMCKTMSLLTKTLVYLAVSGDTDF